MKLITCRLGSTEHIGVLTADGSGFLPLPVPDMNTLIETMSPADLRSAVTAAERGSALALSDVELLAPSAGSQLPRITRQLANIEIAAWHCR